MTLSPLNPPTPHVALTNMVDLGRRSIEDVVNTSFSHALYSEGDPEAAMGRATGMVWEVKEREGMLPPPPEVRLWRGAKRRCCANNSLFATRFVRRLLTSQSFLAPRHASPLSLSLSRRQPYVDPLDRLQTFDASTLEPRSVADPWVINGNLLKDTDAEWRVAYLHFLTGVRRSVGARAPYTSYMM